MKKLMLCGTGGVGKTSVYNRVSEDLGLEKPQSFTREAYASFGLKSEIEAQNLDLEGKLALQVHIFDFYLSKVKSLSDIFLFERSPLDHVAYGMSTLGNFYPFDECWSKAVSLLKEVKYEILYFPYPCPWSNTLNVEDGFRYVDQSKDSDIDYKIKMLIDKLETETNVKVIKLNSFNLQDRVDLVTNLLKG